MNKSKESIYETSYESSIDNLISKCTKCGKCVSKCPVVKHTDIAKIKTKDIQTDLISFLESGDMKENAYRKAYSCMQCFACVDDHCPIGLNPLLINEMVKWKNENNKSEYHDRNTDKDKDENVEIDDYKTQRVLSSIQLSKADYSKISTESKKEKSDYVFFPGCNVYKQPEKILNALDVLDMTGVDYAYMPGLDNCCGDLYNYMGDPIKAATASSKLIDKLSSYSPKKVILWCPTCICRFKYTIDEIMDFPFEVITYSQFIAENLDKLNFVNHIDKKITLHEPCKTSYTGIDLTSVREILSSIPKLELIEMKRHGKDTSCCGSGAITYFLDAFEYVKSERLEEANETNADILVDVCHFCHESFVRAESAYDFKVENYINLLAHALGINREDKYKKYKQMDSVDEILSACRDFIKDSPYSEKKILHILNKEFE